MSGEEQAPVEDGGLVGWLYYTHLKPNRYAFQHTESSHQHQSVAAAMMRRVLDEIRTREGTITASCPLVVDYLSRTTPMPIWSTPVTRGLLRSCCCRGGERKRR